MRVVVACVVVLLSVLQVRADDVQWIVNYNAGTLPSAEWRQVGQPVFKLDRNALRLSDSSAEEAGAFEAEWSGDLDEREIVVEARVQLVSMVGQRNSPVATWPQRDGAPVCIEVSDGKHCEGILLTPPAETHPGAAPGYVRSLTDRFAQVDTRKEMHSYRLVIRGQDMRVEQDGKQIILGRDAFWRPATSPKKFIRFGSTSKPFTGEALWEFVRLGLRAASPRVEEAASLNITISNSWPRESDKKNVESRPYLYNVGRGLLLMSNPQGSDALLEPYAVRRSTDAGKSWRVVPGLDQNVESPQEMVRLADGRILGVSRWVQQQDDGTFNGKTVLLDAEAESFTSNDSRIELPKQWRPSARGEVVIFERNLWQERDGSLTAVAWTRLNRVLLPNGRTFPERRTHLMKSTDLGRHWTHLAQVGIGGEPGVARLSEQEWLCIARPDAHMSNLVQHRSRDGGRTWNFEGTLEEGCVMPELLLMSNGVLACSYGRPVSGIMFSRDGGRTWRDHRVIADRANFNYTTIQEIAPGRLLYMHDAQIPGTLSRINACYIDVDVPK